MSKKRTLSKSQRLAARALGVIVAERERLAKAASPKQKLDRATLAILAGGTFSDARGTFQSNRGRKQSLNATSLKLAFHTKGCPGIGRAAGTGTPKPKPGLGVFSEPVAARDLPNPVTFPTYDGSRSNLAGYGGAGQNGHTWETSQAQEADLALYAADVQATRDEVKRADKAREAEGWKGATAI